MSPRSKKGPSRGLSHHSHHTVPEVPSSPSRTSKHSRKSASSTSRTAQDSAGHSAPRSPMQTQQNPYPQEGQLNRRRSIVLPPGKSDLEILENLKQIIKNGQHEFYRAIPQPAALASLYLGKIPSSEPIGKPAQQGDTQNVNTNGAQDSKSATSPTSPVDPDRRPPRLSGKKDSWDSRRQSLSLPGDKPDPSNGYRPAGSDGPLMSATSESASTIPGIGGMPRNGQAMTEMAGTLLSGSDDPENPPPSHDSPSSPTSPQKDVQSPTSSMHDRNRPYDPQPPSYPRNERQPPRDDRNRRESFSRPYDQNPRNGDDGRRPPAQRGPKQPYATQPPRQQFMVKAEEIPISLSDLDSRGPTSSGALPIPEPASSHIHTRNGNNGPSDDRTRYDDAPPSMAPGRGAPHSDLSGQRLPVDSEQSARALASSDTDFKFKTEHGLPQRVDRDAMFPAASDQRPSGLPSDPTRMPPTNKDSRYGARPPEKYNRPGSPGINGLPRPPYSNRDRDDFRGPPSKGPAHRDYRPAPRDLSRERDYRPPVANNYRPSYDDRTVIDVDDPRYDDRHYRRSFSPPTSTELARDRQRQMHDRFPPSPRTGTDVGYDGGRRYSGPPPASGGGPPRDWYSSQPAPGSYARWEDDPYYNRSGNWDLAPDRTRYDPEVPRRGWDGRADRDHRDSYRGPPPGDERYMPPPPPPARDLDRGRQGPPPSPAPHGSSYGPRTRRLDSPSSARDGPPLKRARDNEYGPAPTGDYYPPPPSSRDPIRRPSDDYHSRGATPPPSSAASSQFYDRTGPPPSSASTNMSVDRDRDFMSRRDSTMEYIPSSMPPPPPPHSANSYDRPRSPGPPPPSGGGGRGMQSGGLGGYGRGGYAPRGMRDNRQGYMPPPGSRP